MFAAQGDPQACCERCSSSVQVILAPETCRGNALGDLGQLRAHPLLDPEVPSDSPDGGGGFGGVGGMTGSRSSGSVAAQRFRQSLDNVATLLVDRSARSHVVAC